MSVLIKWDHCECLFWDVMWVIVGTLEEIVCQGTTVCWKAPGQVSPHWLPWWVVLPKWDWEDRLLWLQTEMSVLCLSFWLCRLSPLPACCPGSFRETEIPLKLPVVEQVSSGCFRFGSEIRRTDSLANCLRVNLDPGGELAKGGSNAFRPQSCQWDHQTDMRVCGPKQKRYYFPWKFLKSVAWGECPRTSGHCCPCEMRIHPPPISMTEILSNSSSV